MIVDKKSTIQSGALTQIILNYHSSQRYLLLNANFLSFFRSRRRFRLALLSAGGGSAVLFLARGESAFGGGGEFLDNLFSLSSFRFGFVSCCSRLTLLKLFHAAGGVNQFLFAGVKGVAIAADFNVNFRLGGADSVSFPASAADNSFIVICWMYIWFHD